MYLFWVKNGILVTVLARCQAIYLVMPLPCSEPEMNRQNGALKVICSTSVAHRRGPEGEYERQDQGSFSVAGVSVINHVNNMRR